MTTTTTSCTSRTLPADQRDRLMSAARPVSLEPGVRLFGEGGRADRFWIIRSGSVTLDMKIPGRRPAVIETLGSGDLVGWSWLFPPHVWHMTARTSSRVTAWEFDAEAVRRMCRDERDLGEAVALWVGRVLAHRLHAARTRLLDLYAPYGSGS
ncbi:cyclic nucleotide-binding domain-containing protein [Streptomyces sp. VRA16 Mangrove soil]|uniref:cyclic nucleotide-binding domain-containing protein n=1 Tax=Streptomyces sp. VRA16 Mangrove soil TaxID=2817434 RepID=UPI001A9E4086|nr:cyclic nucleotide-binding domain-containing protein [Streptomyces sp. VRA16 Mangrove soil]MBO1332291.1 cyclic nucleotide-binding domain-containing protein [Streptomyces sp. VRA16 Mangrove soil]